MSASHSRVRQGPTRAEYTYRRALEPGELLPAIGVAVGVGLAAFYVVKVLLERTPLDVSGSARARVDRTGGGV